MNGMGYWGESTVNSQVNNFKAKYQEFATVLDRLRRNKPRNVNSPEYQQWTTLMGRATTVDGAMKALVTKALQAAAALKSTLGEVNFGALPFFPAALGVAIVAGLATMTYLIDDMLTFSAKEEVKRINEQKAANAAKLKDGRMTQAQFDAAQAQLNASMPVGVLGQATTLVKWVVIGGAVLYFAPQVLKLFGGKK